MSLNFWDTVRGNRLADTLIRELPKLNKKKQQVYIECANHEEVESALEYHLNNGDRYIGSVSIDSHAFLIFEKH